MLKSKDRILFWTLIVCSCVGHIWFFLNTKNLAQKNTETLFLSQINKLKYEKFVTDFDEKQTLILLKELTEGNSQEMRDFEFNLVALKKLWEELDVMILDSTSLNQTNESSGMLKLSGEGFRAAMVLFPLEMSAQVRSRLINQIKNMIPKVKLAGLPYTNHLLDGYSEKIRDKSFPLLFIFIGVFLMALFRPLWIPLVAFVPAIFSSGVSLFAIKLVFGSMNMITATVPLLLFVINLVTSLQLLFSFREEKSISGVLKHKSIPCILMIITTTIGFGSLSFANIEAIRQFGILCAVLIVLSTVHSVVFLLILFKLLPNDLGRFRIRWEERVKFFGIGGKEKGLIYSVFVVSFILAIVLFPNISREVDATTYFPSKTNVRNDIADIGKRVLGYPIIDIVLPWQDEDPEFSRIKAIDQFEQSLEKRLQKSVGEGFQLISANKMVKVANEIYSGVPALPDFYLSYVTLKSKTPPVLSSSFSLEEGYRLSLFGPLLNGEQYQKVIKIIEEVLQEHKLVYYNFSGLHYYLHLAQVHLIDTLAKSFLMSLLLIGLIVLIYFRTLKSILVFLIVNLTPLTLLVCFIYLFRMGLNVSSVMTFSISLGLLVDSTIHLYHGFKLKQEINYIIKTTLVPIIVATISFFLSFLVLGFSDFVPVSHFGICLSVCMFVGFICDVVFVPVLVKR